LKANIQGTFDFFFEKNTSVFACFFLTCARVGSSISSGFSGSEQMHVCRARRIGIAVFFLGSVWGT
jgi:hypothetical protein